MGLWSRAQRGFGMATHCPQSRLTLWGAQQLLWRSALGRCAPRSHGAGALEPQQREMGPVMGLEGRLLSTHSVQ